MAVQDVLAGLRNPAAARQAILSRLKIDPSKVKGFNNAGFDQEINDLYRQGADTATGLDSAEGNYNRTYQQNLAQAAVDRDRSLKAIRENFASRGMSFSGAQVDELGRAGEDYNRYVGNLGSDRSANLLDIGKRRTNLIEALTRGRQGIEQGYGEGVGDFLHEQAVALWNWNAAQAANQGGGGGGSSSRPRSSSGSSGGGGTMPRSSGGGTSRPRASVPSAPRTVSQSAIPSSRYTGAYIRPVQQVQRTPRPVKKGTLRGQGFGGGGPF